MADALSRAVSRERLKLPTDVRNAVEEEIHGVRCRALKETPELVQQSLQNFRNELDLASFQKRQVYDRIASSVAERRHEEQLLRRINNTIQTIAPTIGQHQPQQQNLSNNLVCSHTSPYTTTAAMKYTLNHQPQNSSTTTTTPITKNYATEDDEFRLRFLRCELFDAKKAVERFLNYLNLVYELWGFAIVSRRLVQEKDFSPAEYKYLKKGCIQLLPFRDRSGRRVIVLSDEDPADPGFSNVACFTMIKCYLYVVDVASRDSVESQQKGAVWLTAPNGIISQIQNSFPFVGIFSRSCPTRIVAFHHYMRDPMTYRLFEKHYLAMYATGSISVRLVRERSYVGYTKLEMKHHLLGYGIPPEYMPWTNTGKIKTKYWKGWLKSRSLIESNRLQDQALVWKIVECPGANDVVFRHGQSYKKFHAGNETLRKLINSELVLRKVSAGRSALIQLSDQLIHEIETNQNGRFLRWDKKFKVWVRMQDKMEIKKKIEVTFYNHSKRKCDTLIQEEHIKNVDVSNNILFDTG